MAFLTEEEKSQVVRRTAMVCDYCRSLIHIDDPCVSLFVGKCGPSRKSGRLMTIEDEREVMNPEVNLHQECVMGYAQDAIEVDEHFFEPKLCDRCEELLEIDE